MYTVNKYDKSGIYKITCQSRQKVYIGQTGRNFKTRFKEHIRNIRFNKDESAYAQHILNQGHQYGPIEKIMEIIEQARKGNLMNIKESYYIYKYEQTEDLIEQNKKEKEKDNQSLLFEIAIGAGTYTRRNDIDNRRV
jgi:hypothetical protein